MDKEVFLALLSLILGVLIPLTIKFHYNKSFGTRLYSDRDSAKNNMITDMTQSEEMYFIGISHSMITDYFEEALALNNNNKLPWKEIHFFFPDSIYGKCWDSNFDKKINLQILQICNFLFGKFANYCPQIKGLYFHNYKGPISFGGSLFKYVKSKNSVDVIYDVQQIAKKELKKSRTIRINYSFSSHRMFFKRFFDCFEEIKNDSFMLYEIDCINTNLWNNSVQKWNFFEQNYKPYQRSMEYMLDQINLASSRNILSLGVGTGEMELMIIENRHFKGFLGLVDNSYTMLNNAFAKLKRFENVSYSLVDLSKEWKLYGDLSNKKYDYILIHFSIHHFINSNQSTSDFARKLTELLEVNGEIVIAIHDNIYNGPKKEDKLRNLIICFAEKNKIPIKSNSHNISLHQLKNGFYKNGLTIISEQDIDIDRIIEDRIAMWEVEAILGALLDLNKLTIELKVELYKQLDNLKGELLVKPIAITKVQYLHFGKKIIVSSALIQNNEGEVLTVVKNGYYLLPGGEKHFDESEIETLYRELLEELSIKKNELEIIENIGKFNFDKAFIEDIPLEMNVYRCKIESTTELNVAYEITKYEWLNEEKFKNLELMPRAYFNKIFEKAKVKLPKTKI